MSGLLLNGTADKVDALQALVPGAEWTLAGDTLTWLDEKISKQSD